jgi:hypothetical protein
MLRCLIADLFYLLTTLISDGAGGLAGRLTGGLAFPAATRFNCLVQLPRA